MGLITVVPERIVHESHQMGRARWLVRCECGRTFWAYIWSLAGSGKRCPGCGLFYFYHAGTLAIDRKLRTASPH